jgi:electron transfer flavoprotein beta subunit
MRVLVCIKRVPSTAERIDLTPDRLAIDTQHVGFTIAPHEECAVEEAIRLVEAHGGETVVLTVGPADAIEQLRDALALGIGRAIHLRIDDLEWDPESTAAAIVDAVRADEQAAGPFDLLLFGTESADAAGYQVGVRVARALGRPIVTRVKHLALSGGTIRAEQEVAGGRDAYELPLPAAVGVLEGLNMPRYVSVPGRLRAKSKPVAVLSPERPAQRLELEALEVPPAPSKRAQVLGHGRDAAPAVVDLLRSLGVA